MEMDSPKLSVSADIFYRYFFTLYLVDFLISRLFGDLGMTKNSTQVILPNKSTDPEPLVPVLVLPLSLTTLVNVIKRLISQMVNIFIRILQLDQSATPKAGNHCLYQDQFRNHLYPPMEINFLPSSSGQIYFINKYAMNNILPWYFKNEPMIKTEIQLSIEHTDRKCQSPSLHTPPVIILNGVFTEILCQIIIGIIVTANFSYEL